MWIGLMALAWLTIGVYGVAAYGHNHYVYRGFGPPSDPAGVAAVRPA
jgi:hypothetical protein